MEKVLLLRSQHLSPKANIQNKSFPNSINAPSQNLALDLCFVKKYFQFDD